jgi:RimJ/RimL family protein N-acetyltransferase
MILSTERLILRDFVDGDWPAVLAYQRDPRYLRFYEADHRTPEEVQAFVRRFIAQQSETPRQRHQPAIVLRDIGQLIGNVGIRIRSAGAYQADIGYEIDPKHWGHGYASEAARRIVRFGFEELHLHRITAHCLAENGASARVLQKVGMHLEGRMRDSEHFKGRYWDTLHYAILEEEWRQQYPLGLSETGA